MIELYHNEAIILKDTVQYAITDKHGRWHGSGLGDTRDNYLLFKKDFKFEKTGLYHFHIKHGMRANTLKGCEKIGLKIK